MREITGKTKLLAVIGDPIEHTLSPLMHNAALDRMRLNYVYLPLPIQAAALKAAIHGFEAIGLVGFNITIPHKQAIMPFLGEISATAQAVGAVNTVWRTAQGWSGTNTDVEGFLAPLNVLNLDWSGREAVVLGNGGAARAVVAGLALLGCGRTHVIGRNVEKLQIFEQSWAGSTLQGNLRVHPWQALSQVLPGTSLVVNTTPVGMSPHVDQAPLTTSHIQLLPPGAIVYDLIYVPNPTRLLQAAQAHGLSAIDGLEMLVQQGASALKIWTQQDVPVDVMRQTLRQHLGL